MGQLALFDFKTPTMPKLDTARCYVRPVNYLTASNMVTQYHYAHRTPSIVAAFGMYVDNVLAGVITYGSPSSRNATELCGEQYRNNVLELTRLFVFDWCGRNTESWFVGQTFQQLPIQWREFFILVSYADAGQNHIGYIYQATNWIYTGQTGIERTGYIINGEFMHRRTVNAVYGSSSESYVKGLIPNSEPVFDIGKHRYVYFLGDKRQRRKLRKALKWDVLPYPKGGA